MAVNSAPRKMVTITIILLFVCSAFAILPALATEPQNEPDQKYMTIKGTVIDGSTEKPVANAIVFIWNELNEYKTTTNEQGQFSFQVPYNGYHVKVTAEGYHAAEQFVEKTEQTEVQLRILLKPIESRPDPMFVFGMVFKEGTEEPIIEAHLLFYNENNEFKTFSGEAGKYEISLPPGHYRVQVFKPGYQERLMEVSGESNNEVELNIALEPLPEDPEPVIVAVKGMVLIAETDKPIAGAWIAIKSQDGDSREAVSDEGGNFLLELHEGVYAVHAGAEGYQETNLKLELMNVEEYYLEIFLTPRSSDDTDVSGTLKGMVLDATTQKPIAGAGVVITKLSPKSNEKISFEARTNDEGTFTFENIPPGGYLLMVRAEGYHVYESEIWIGYGRLTDEDPDANLNTIDGKTNYVRVPLKPNDEKRVPRLSGTVFDAKTNKPMPAMVILESESIMPKMKFLVLGIRWGQIPCDPDAAQVVNWDGFLQVTDGFVVLVRPDAWDKGDQLHEQTNPMTIEWSSKTRPCYDGLIFLIVVPANAEPAPHVTIHTEKWSHVFQFDELVNIHKIIPVDRIGNKVEIGTRLIDVPDDRKPERPPCDQDRPDERPDDRPNDRPDQPPDDPDEQPKDPPQEPDRPDDNQPPRDEPQTRGESDDIDTVERNGFSLGIGEEQMRGIKEMISKHLREQKQKRQLITKTDDKGRYWFMDLPPGHYQMWVKSRGYIEYYNEFTIRDDQHLKVDVYLRPGGDERQCVTVLKGIVMHARTNEGIAKAKLTFERIVPEKAAYDKTSPRDTDKQVRDIQGTDRKMTDKQVTDKQVTDKPLKDLHTTDKPTRTFTTYTNERGHFEIKLPCGFYKVTVEARGYETHVQRLKITQEGPEAIRVPLKPGSATDATTDGTGVDTRDLGVQLLDDDSLGASITGILIALMVLGVLLPIFFVVNRSKSKKSQPKPKKTVKRTAKRTVKRKVQTKEI